MAATEPSPAYWGDKPNHLILDSRVLGENDEENDGSGSKRAIFVQMGKNLMIFSERFLEISMFRESLICWMLGFCDILDNILVKIAAATSEYIST